MPSPNMADDLWKAIACGDVESLAKLIDEEPALIEARSKWGNSPLKHAAEAKQADTLRILLERGADPNAELRLVSPVSGRVDSGYTAMMAAGSLECIQELAAAGANIDAQDSEGRSVFKHQALLFDSSRMQLLKDLGAKISDDELGGLLNYARDELEFRVRGQEQAASDRIAELRQAIAWLEAEAQQSRVD